MPTFLNQCQFEKIYRISFVSDTVTHDAHNSSFKGFKVVSRNQVGNQHRKFDIAKVIVNFCKMKLVLLLAIFLHAVAAHSTFLCSNAQLKQLPVTEVSKMTSLSGTSIMWKCWALVMLMWFLQWIATADIMFRATYRQQASRPRGGRSRS